MPSLTTAFNYAVNACNDPYIGYAYTASVRETITLGVNYRTYCDCSSFISKCLTEGGYFKNNPWFYTGDMCGFLERAGWRQQSLDGVWMPGDVLWKSGHTEMVYEGGTGRGRTMGAHTSNVAYEAQVNIAAEGRYSYASRWTRLYRDPTQTVQVYKWYMSNSYLNDYDDNMTGNAYMIFSYFSKLGFTNESIAGMLGNMQRESTINPGVWQNLEPGSYDDDEKGYGLVQWTPPRGWFDYASAHNIDTTDADESGDGQCACVNNCTNDGQWLPNHPTAVSHNVRYTWAEFAALTDVDEAVKAFCWEYLRPASDPSTLRMDLRLEYAAHWYDTIINNYWSSVDPGAPAGRPDQLRRGIITDLQRRIVIPGWP